MRKITLKAERLMLAGLLFVIGISMGVSPLSVQAQSLSELLPPLLEKHERIIAAKEDLVASKRGLQEAYGDWLPTGDITFNLGTEIQKKGNDTQDEDRGFRNFEFSASQLIYDFGKTGATIDSAKLSYEQSRLGLNSARQGLILEATSAYINLLTSVQGLHFARQSEANTKKQTGMEQSRVKRGSGFSSDVLQAKAQLAGAQANTVSKQGALVNAIDRYRTVFRIDKVEIKELKKVRVPYGMLPKNLKSAIETAKKNSISLKLSEITVELAKQTIRTKKSAFAPALNASYDYKAVKDNAGIQGLKDTFSSKIELTYPLVNGGKDIAGLRQSFNSLSAAEKRHTDATHGIVEQVRNAWQNLATSRATAGFLRNQANISGEFLELARKERKLGTRTLLDVLAGETSFITSISSAIQAEAARDLAAYNLFFAMGLLTLDNVETGQKTSVKGKPLAKSSKKQNGRKGYAP